MAQTLDNNHGHLPFDRLFNNSASVSILDFLLSNYDLKFSVDEISKINNIPINLAENILKDLLEEKIVATEKDALETLYFANFSSARTEGLFQYVRATLDENLKAHEGSN